MSDTTAPKPVKDVDVDVDVLQPGFSRKLKCVVCGKPLRMQWERKVHKGDCARKRELQLQQLRRDRARR